MITARHLRLVETPVVADRRHVDLQVHSDQRIEIAPMNSLLRQLAETPAP